ncbi:MAG TPA: SDR family NAD(P)-dependent oxidoreductase, partial [Gemmatimonadales bacterium]|nr:SDR family NAD(P)-dependent oxidoreductase [Gemmatimonadales bacterium]
GKVAALRCDVSRRDEVITLVRQVNEHLGPVDVLINNAGMIEVGPAEEMTVDDYERAMGVHFHGPLYAMTEVVSDMRERGAGRIVNVASVGGKISVAHLLPYCASKFALVGLSSGFRAVLAADGIAVTTVCPGLMRTGSPRNAAFKARHRAEYAWFSIGDALPVLSMDAECAARRILEACRRGDAELVMPATTAAAVKLSALFPAAAAAALTLVEEILPRPGGIGVDTKRGYESTSRWSPSWLTTLSDRAAVRNNQFS